MPTIQLAPVRESTQVPPPFIADPGAEAPTWARFGLGGLFPEGRLWRRVADETSNLQHLLRGLSRELAVVDSRSTQLLELEADPRRTVEVLAEWERMAGLPDPCLPATASIPQRQSRLVNRLVGARGQSPQHFLDLFGALGYTLSLEELRPFWIGTAAAGDPIHGEGWAFVLWFRVNLPASASGEAAGDPTGAAVLCIMGTIKPAQTLVRVYFGTLAMAVARSTSRVPRPFVIT